MVSPLTKSGATAIAPAYLVPPGVVLGGRLAEVELLVRREGGQVGLGGRLDRRRGSSAEVEFVLAQGRCRLFDGKVGGAEIEGLVGRRGPKRGDFECAVR